MKILWRCECVAISTLACIPALAVAPALNRPALRSLSQQSILPGGRIITPYGDQFLAGPGPFGMAVGANGRFVVAADSGPRFALSVLDNRTNRMTDFATKHGNDNDDEDEWRGVFMGVAFRDDSTVFASEGESGRVRLIDIRTGDRLKEFDLNRAGYADSYTGDLAYDAARRLLFVVDQANFRIAIVNAQNGRTTACVRTGRLPFAIAYSAARRELYVTNVGMFEYRPVPGADPSRAKQTGLPFPAFGFPSEDALNGATRHTERGTVDVPGLGDPNVVESNSLSIIDVSDATRPKTRAFVRTGVPFSSESLGGSSPSGVTQHRGIVYVSNANQDTITVIDAATARKTADIPLRIPGFEELRGVLPIGLTVAGARGWLLVAEAGINAVGIIDLEHNRVLGHIPAGWFPTAVRTYGGSAFVTNAKGAGTGPNSDDAIVRANSFQGSLRRGTVSRFRLPSATAISGLTNEVLSNNGFTSRDVGAPGIPAGLDHVVIIVKENRTYDEVYGDLGSASNGPRNGVAQLARFGRAVTPNHHAFADLWSTSDNFYADSEVSVDGHHWIVGSYPNAWTTSALNSSYGGQRSFRMPTSAPGRLQFAGANSSVHPEEQLEAGSIWHHLERNGISFRNFGEGFELAGNDESQGLEPTGARLLTNVPMPEPLYRNTSRDYPGFNMNIPDQYRADHFMREMQDLYGEGKRPFPRLLFIHLPNDHTDHERPEDGYPSKASYVADNDLALGRIVEFLSHTPEWKRMAIFITEDDAQGGVDHVDSHRTVLAIVSPYAKRNYVSHVNTSFAGMLRTVFEILRIPPLNQFDAAASDLADCFDQATNFSGFQTLIPETSVFDVSRIRIHEGKPGVAMDDPRFIEQEHRAEPQSSTAR